MPLVQEVPGTCIESLFKTDSRDACNHYSSFPERSSSPADFTPSAAASRFGAATVPASSWPSEIVALSWPDFASETGVTAAKCLLIRCPKVAIAVRATNAVPPARMLNSSQSCPVLSFRTRNSFCSMMLFALLGHG